MTFTPASWSRLGNCESSRLPSHTASLTPRATRDSVLRVWRRLTVTCAFAVLPAAYAGAVLVKSKNKKARRDAPIQLCRRLCRLKDVHFLAIRNNLLVENELHSEQSKMGSRSLRDGSTVPYR